MITLDQINNKIERWYKFKPFMNQQKKAKFEEIPQMLFLSQLDPNGHLIYNRQYYPDIWKQVPEKGHEKEDNPPMTWACKEVERVSIPLQQVKLSKQLTAICGNKLHFDMFNTDPSEEQEKEFALSKQKWILYQFDSCLYEFFNSVLATGDGAICLNRNSDGETSYKVFSIINDDTLHPIFDVFGKLKIFGRSYSNDDNINSKSITYLEVWDDVYHYLFSTDQDMANKSLGNISWDENTYKPITDADTTGSTFYPVIKEAHGFKEIPIVYKKNDDGACWYHIQYLFDALELALSELFENNKTYAFRIMYIQGGFEVVGTLRGNSKEPSVIELDDSNSKVGFVEGADVSSSFKEQLEKTMEFIKMCGFIVTPPQSLSGDTSGTAVKILYSPMIEQAIRDIHFFNSSIRRTVKLFMMSIGTEKDSSPSTLNTIKINAYYTPYVPQNEQENVTNLNTAYAGGNGYLSAQTCQEKDNNCTPQEAFRVQRERNKKYLQESKKQPDVPVIENKLNTENNARKLLAENGQGKNNK